MVRFNNATCRFPPTGKPGSRKKTTKRQLTLSDKGYRKSARSIKPLKANPKFRAMQHTKNLKSGEADSLLNTGLLPDSFRGKNTNRVLHRQKRCSTMLPPIVISMGTCKNLLMHKWKLKAYTNYLTKGTPPVSRQEKTEKGA